MLCWFGRLRFKGASKLPTPPSLPAPAHSVEDPTWELARHNIGAIVRYANNTFSDLSKMFPNGDLSSTQYALANPGSEYLIV